MRELAPMGSDPVTEEEASRVVSDEERSFEELQRELDGIVARLERGDVPVDDAIALFRRGEELYRACVERLQAAELRVEELTPAEPRAEGA